MKNRLKIIILLLFIVCISVWSIVIYEGSKLGWFDWMLSTFSSSKISTSSTMPTKILTSSQDVSLTNSNMDLTTILLFLVFLLVVSLIIYYYNKIKTKKK
ncbi:hypothetical protein [Calidifontibacillus oryziterrae]|uniref:hypothetical protein n=1 Tax=Calidifontibacillus oryziterrae TaxID=1191699 RepID=UPI0012B59769|nr:hypothetical protein [Calidifontibacillus oryziterrae]